MLKMILVVELWALFAFPRVTSTHAVSDIT